MADSAWTASLAAAATVSAEAPRHRAVVRVTHWLTALFFLALLVSGVEILISHPRFYWGETGNVMNPPLFKLPIPASRSAVPTGYGYVLPDQNGWSRSLHFQAAWGAVFTGALYLFWGLLTGHFRRNLLPGKDALAWSSLSAAVRNHLQWRMNAEFAAYNALQRLSYLAVIFVLFPLVIWTGLAMSPGVVSAYPAIVTLLGGQQSARTIHFFVALSLVVFLAVHVAMVCRAGFKRRMRGMIGGGVEDGEKPI